MRVRFGIRWSSARNPIVVAFRAREDVRNVYALNQWISFLEDGWDGSICHATIAQQRRARRALLRLLAKAITS